MFVPFPRLLVLLGPVTFVCKVANRGWQCGLSWWNETDKAAYAYELTFEKEDEPSDINFPIPKNNLIPSVSPLHGIRVKFPFGLGNELLS